MARKFEKFQAKMSSNKYYTLPEMLEGTTWIPFGKKAFILVGVLVSSLSLIHKGLEDPDREGPGEAIEEGH